MWRTVPTVLLAVVTLACFSVKAPGREREEPREPAGEPRQERREEPRRERPEELEALHARLAELRERVAQLERAGKVDEARQLAGEARELQQDLQRLTDRRDVELPRRPHFAARLEQLREQLRELREAGRGESEDAEQLQREMAALDALAGALRERGTPPGHLEADPHRPPAHHELLMRQLRHLHAAAENLAAAGLADQAAALRSHAERLERELHQQRGPQQEPPPFVRELHERMERLERQLAELREIVEDLRRRVEAP